MKASTVTRRTVMDSRISASCIGPLGMPKTDGRSRIRHPILLSCLPLFYKNGRPKKCPECGDALVHEIDRRPFPYADDVWRCTGLIENPINPQGELIACWFEWRHETNPEERP